MDAHSRHHVLVTLSTHNFLDYMHKIGSLNTVMERGGLHDMPLLRIFTQLMVDVEEREMFSSVV